MTKLMATAEKSKPVGSIGNRLFFLIVALAESGTVVVIEGWGGDRQEQSVAVLMKQTSVDLLNDCPDCNKDAKHDSK